MSEPPVEASLWVFKKFLSIFPILLIFVSIAAIISLPIQAVLEAFYWLRSGEWINYSWSNILPFDVRVWIYGDSQDWVGLRSLLSKAIQLWITVPLAIFGGIVLMLLNLNEGV